MSPVNPKSCASYLCIIMTLSHVLNIFSPSDYCRAPAEVYQPLVQVQVLQIVYWDSEGHTVGHVSPSVLCCMPQIGIWIEAHGR